MALVVTWTLWVIRARHHTVWTATTADFVCSFGKKKGQTTRDSGTFSSTSSIGSTLAGFAAASAILFPWSFIPSLDTKRTRALFPATHLSHCGWKNLRSWAGRKTKSQVPSPPTSSCQRNVATERVVLARKDYPQPEWQCAIHNRRSTLGYLCPMLYSWHLGCRGLPLVAWYSHLASCVLQLSSLVHSLHRDFQWLMAELTQIDSAVVLNASQSDLRAFPGLPSKALTHEEVCRRK